MDMQQPYFFAADAHEGPVWVAGQCRLYFTTKTHLDDQRRVSILYLDFSSLGPCDGPDIWDCLTVERTSEVKLRTFVHDANMANSMCLGPDGRSLLVAEQGDEHRPSVISRISLDDGTRTVVVDEFEGKPFNSLNKVIVSERGHLIFSDPDYGFRQGFRPPPALEPALYVLTPEGELTSFDCGLEMPHGLALTPDERTLFVTDTSNDGAHGDDVELNRRKSVWRFAFDPAAGRLSGSPTCCFSVDEGVPDGMVTTQDRLLVGGGDGVYVADLNGELTGKLPTPYTAVNVALAGGGNHLFATVEHGVQLFVNWPAFVREAVAG